MDISLKIKHLLFLAILAFPVLGHAQVGATQSKTAFKNTPLKIWGHDITNAGLNLYSNPSNGTIIQYYQGTKGVDTLIYMPNEDFLGTDEFSFSHFTFYPNPNIPNNVITTVKIKIVPSYVEAQHDYTAVTVDQSTTIRVITNDSVTHGNLTVDPIFPVVNHGTVSVADERGYVNFTPEAGYTGLADFSYIACDTVGTCATGAVTIYVNPENKTYNDEIRLGTGQNTAKAIPMPFKVTSVVPATNVKIEKSEYAVIYEPTSNFHGPDQFTVYGEDGNQRVINIDVIERSVNAVSLAEDDIAYGILGEPVTLDIISNDAFTGVSNISFPSVQGGSVTYSNGQITFTPEEDFRGVARILYRVFDYNYNEHQGYAYIVYDRNNFGPNVKDYEYTFKLNPGQVKIIDYKAPINNYRLSPTDGFDNIAGYIAVETTKSVRYEAPEEAGATDEFEVSYCVPANSSNCQQVKIRIDVVAEKVENCNGDCVFPGDLNKDGIVNSADLLPLGFHVGAKGPARNDQSTTFRGAEADDWNMDFIDDAETVNLKHYDANGDGIITEQDVNVIRKNYGAIREIVPNALPALSKGISITPNRVTPSKEQIAVGEAIPAGSRVEFDIVLGDESAQELDLYGFTFPFKLTGKSFIDTESFTVKFSDDSWAALNAPTLNLAQNVSGENSDELQFDLAFTRTSSQPVSGIGVVATVGFVVVEDAIGLKLPEEVLNLKIEIGQGYAIDGRGTYYEYGSAAAIDLPITFEQKETEELVASQLVVFPNPVSDQLNVHLNSFNFHVNSISLYNMTGQEVYRSMPLATKRFPISVSGLAEGLYIMSVQTDGGVLSKKVEVLRR